MYTYAIIFIDVYIYIYTCKYIHMCMFYTFEHIYSVFRICHGRRKRGMTKMTTARISIESGSQSPIAFVRRTNRIHEKSRCSKTL